MRKIVGLGIMLVISLILINCASATPVKYKTNGHSYDVIATPKAISWDNAKLAAECMGGHLATITSQGENNFIQTILPDQNAYWIGGYQTKDITIPKNGWKWVTGEKWSYINWSPEEPNDFGGAEDKLIFYYTGNWNDDVPKSIYSHGFIIEYQ